jgi:hypothetical protein
MNALRRERQLGKKTHINAIMQEEAHDHARSLARFTAGRMVGRCAMRPGSARGVHWDIGVTRRTATGTATIDPH